MARAAARRVARLERDCARHAGSHGIQLDACRVRAPHPATAARAPGSSSARRSTYLALGWLLVGAGLLPHIAAGLALLVVAGVCVLAPVVTPSAYGWADLAIALLSSVMVARWMPTSQPRSRTR
jgi:hypothetical protein